MPRLIRGWMAVSVALAGLAVLTMAGPAWAHSTIVRSTPQADATLAELPEAFRVTADDPLPGAAPTSAPAEAADSAFPWPAIATGVAAVLALLVAVRAARIQQRARAADRLPPPTE